MTNTGDNFDDNACDGTDELDYGSSNNNKMSENNYDPLIWKPVFNINTTNSNSSANSSPQIAKNLVGENKKSGPSPLTTFKTINNNANKKSFLPHLSSIVDYSSNSNESNQPTLATSTTTTTTIATTNIPVMTSNNQVSLEGRVLDINDTNENKESGSSKHKKKKKNKDKAKSKDKEKDKEKEKDKDKEKEKEKKHHHHHKASHHHKKKDKEKNKSALESTQLDSSTANALSPSSSNKKKDKKLLKKLKKEQKKVERSANLEGTSNTNDSIQVRSFQKYSIIIHYSKIELFRMSIQFEGILSLPSDKILGVAF